MTWYALLWLWNLPRFRNNRLFAYDKRRFWRHAGAFHPESKEAQLAMIISYYHVVEKGLTMPAKRLSFGHQAVLRLIETIGRYISQFGDGNIQIQHAIGVVKAYRDWHLGDGYAFSTEPDYWTQIDEFVSVHSGVPSSSQMRMTRRQFFDGKDSCFAVFSKARHTLRHYDAKPLPVEKIHTAVELALTTPSACNRQHSRVYCVANHQLRDQVLKLQTGNSGFGDSADKLLVVTSSLEDICGCEERNDAYVNGGMFLMNLCYALYHNEVAHCILNWSVIPKHDLLLHKLLKIPPSEVVIAIVSCGESPAVVEVAMSPRKRISEILTVIT